MLRCHVKNLPMLDKYHACLDSMQIDHKDCKSAHLSTFKVSIYKYNMLAPLTSYLQYNCKEVDESPDHNKVAKWIIHWSDEDNLRRRMHYSSRCNASHP